MKFTIFPKGAELGTVKIPGTPLTFQVHRLGFAPYVEHMRERSAGVFREALANGGDLSEEAIRKAATSSGLAVDMILNPDVHGGALLVSGVEGLSVDDVPADWTLELGEEFFREYPPIMQMVVEEATAAEERFLALLGGAEKNSEASSAGPTASDATPN